MSTERVIAKKLLIFKIKFVLILLNLLPILIRRTYQQYRILPLFCIRDFLFNPNLTYILFILLDVHVFKKVVGV